MRIKCVVKNDIIFDLIFDTDQKKSKFNFSCSAGEWLAIGFCIGLIRRLVVWPLLLDGVLLA